MNAINSEDFVVAAFGSLMTWGSHHELLEWDSEFQLKMGFVSCLEQAKALAEKSIRIERKHNSFYADEFQIIDPAGKVILIGSAGFGDILDWKVVH